MLKRICSDLLREYSAGGEKSLNPIVIVDLIDWGNSIFV